MHNIMWIFSPQAPLDSAWQMCFGRRVRRAAPLLAGRLPVYATDSELIASIFGARSGDQAYVGAYRSLTRRPDFPRLNLLLGGRHVPSVLDWFERYEATHAVESGPSEEERAERWNRSATRRRA